MTALRSLCLVALTGMLLATASSADVSRSALSDVSNRIVDIYDRADVPALLSALAPETRREWSVGEMTQRLAECRSHFGTLTRVSLPVAGGRTFGILAAYFEGGTVRDMFLEIDDSGLIRNLTLSGGGAACSLTQP